MEDEIQDIKAWLGAFEEKFDRKVSMLERKIDEIKREIDHIKRTAEHVDYKVRQLR